MVAQPGALWPSDFLAMVPTTVPRLSFSSVAVLAGDPSATAIFAGRIPTLSPGTLFIVACHRSTSLLTLTAGIRASTAAVICCDETGDPG
jgi:hypothetical protein